MYVTCLGRAVFVHRKQTVVLRNPSRSVNRASKSVKFLVLQASVVKASLCPYCKYLL